MDSVAREKWQRQESSMMILRSDEDAILKSEMVQTTFFTVHEEAVEEPSSGFLV